MKKNKKRLKFYIFPFAFIFFIFPLVSLATAFSGNRDFISKPGNKKWFQTISQDKKKKKRKESAKPKVTQVKLISVPPGRWGAPGINLVVEESGVKIQYDCAAGEITQKLLIDERGGFSLNGVYIRRYPGALRVNLPPKGAAALYEGKISGDKMTLKVTLTETDETLEEVVLQRNSTARFRKCY